MFNLLLKRITVIVGHYGSGKTELSVNLAVYSASKGARILKQFDK
jgi:Mrp family chromosome partitioning ATPase